MGPASCAFHAVDLIGSILCSASHVCIPYSVSYVQCVLCAVFHVVYSIHCILCATKFRPLEFTQPPVDEAAGR